MKLPAPPARAPGPASAPAGRGLRTQRLRPGRRRCSLLRSCPLQHQGGGAARSGAPVVPGPRPAPLMHFRTRAVAPPRTQKRTQKRVAPGATDMSLSLLIPCALSRTAPSLQPVCKLSS
ncbi:calcium/calmodulin-dependent protein kinase II inhibitor 2 isoform X1 [Notamacropus eugenii]|uniref:calcium/calmodulin-dependent protein kinase II inhibitor 2 isoform X1 n=1 Tax=Notamacropus eugenii TaxID=9315 RepID=UPI003B6703FE